MTSSISSAQVPSHLQTDSSLLPPPSRRNEPMNATPAEMVYVILPSEQPEHNKSWCAKHKLALISTGIVCLGCTACALLVPVIILVAQYVNLRRNGI
jgi:hypothetical protein